MTPAAPRSGWRRRIVLTAALMPLAVCLIAGVLSLASAPGWAVYVPITAAGAAGALLAERWKELSALERSVPPYGDSLAEDDTA